MPFGHPDPATSGNVRHRANHYFGDHRPTRAAILRPRAETALPVPNFGLTPDSFAIQKRLQPCNLFRFVALVALFTFAGMKMRRAVFVLLGPATVVAVSGLVLSSSHKLVGASGGRKQLGPPFSYQILFHQGRSAVGVALFHHRGQDRLEGQRSSPAPTATRSRTSSAPKPPASAAGSSAITKIMFGAGYFDGRPDPGTRIDPEQPAGQAAATSTGRIAPQPFRSRPRSLALTPDGSKLYVTLPGREGYPDWRVAVVDTQDSPGHPWVDLRPAGRCGGMRPIGVKISPVNTAIFAHPTSSSSTSTAISPASSTPATTR